MKITIFNGSPRGENSNTNVITTAFKEGAESSGAVVSNYNLINKKINHCTGCFSCWYMTPGKCVHNDDMEKLFEAYKNSDIVCFATPVYSWVMTACLKNFVDRLIPLKCPTVVETDGHFDMENSSRKSPDIVVIANAGFPGENNFRTLKTVMSAANPILEIYRNCGMLLRSADIDIQGKVTQFLDFVKQAGSLIAKGEEVTEEIIDGMQMELLAIDKYLEYISGTK